MPLPLSRRLQRAALVLVVLLVLREWNIRRHEAAIAEWPRVSADLDADPASAAS